MKRIITICLFLISFSISSQKWINDSNCDAQSYEILNEALNHLSNLEQLTAVGMAKAAKISDSGCECANLVIASTAATTQWGSRKAKLDKINVQLLSGEEKAWYVHDRPGLANFQGYDIAMIPWITAETYADTMNFINNTSAQVAMGHLEIKGFEMHSGIMSDHGIDKTLFNNFDMVMSGHFHKRSSDGHINYLGCPYEMNWADSGDPKGFHTFDITTRELEFIPNTRSMFIKVRYDDRTDKDYLGMDLSQFEGKFVKVFVEHRNDYYAFDKFMDRLYKEISVTDLKVVEDFSDLSADLVHDDVVEGAQDTLSLLDRYVDEIDTILDKDRIKSKLKSLYIESSDLEA